MAGIERAQRPRYDVADVLAKAAPAFLAERPLPPQLHKVVHDILACRTAALGGHVDRCNSCGFERPSYNSCRNRHCPKCQGRDVHAWKQRRLAELLPVSYFHLVFTLPHALNPLVLANKALLLSMLFRAASRTLLQFGRRQLGGDLGVTMVLHTWDQTLGPHYHVHCLVPGGALSRQQERWICAPNARFLFPVRALSKVFRGKFLALLCKARAAGRLRFTAASSSWSELLGELGSRPFIVYAKPPFASPERVLDYLARYTHRIAISNHRLVHVDDHVVRFRYRSRAGPAKVMTLDLREFTRRFLLHVLPPAFVRIRHYGFLSNPRKGRALERCRRLLRAPEKNPADAADPCRVSHDDPLPPPPDDPRCPECGARLVRVELLPARVSVTSTHAPPLARPP